MGYLANWVITLITPFPFTPLADAYFWPTIQKVICLKYSELPISRFLDPSLKVFGMMLWGILQNTAGNNHNLPKNVLQMYSDIWLPDFDSEKWLSSLLSIRLNWKKSLKISIISIGKISQLTKICMRNVFDALLNYVLHSTKVGSNYIFSILT